MKHSQKTRTEKPDTTTTLTRLCDAVADNYYIYLTIEMESQDTPATFSTANNASTKSIPFNLSIITFRKMLSSAVQDLFGGAMGGGINMDILGYWTDSVKDPYNRLASFNLPPPSTPKTILAKTLPSLAESLSTSSSSSPSSSSSSPTPPTVLTAPTFSSTTAASAVLRCHSLDINQLWSSLVLFNTLVDEYEARFEVRYISSTLLGLQANSRQLQWT